METDGGGWIVFQRRVDASVDFNRNWNEYRNGFGDLNGNFWLGLEKIHKLAEYGKLAILRVDIVHMDYPSRLYAKYDVFWVDTENLQYAIYAHLYSGNATNSFYDVRYRRFSTRDRDNDYGYGNLAVENKGGWWYRNQPVSSLNSLYPMDNQTNHFYMTWHALKNEYGKVTFSEMKLKYHT